MALTTFSSSFTSSPSPTWGYEVFVSYNGDDTGKSFTDHLFSALKRHEIRAFRDDKELPRGKDIWTELEKAIETSRIAIIVFSINYAASSWCLDELAKILECKRSLQQIVLPIFYTVEPSKLRALKGNLAQVFASHVERFGEDKVQRWRAALTEAANLAGWDSGNDAHRSESKLIEKIIGDILIKLNLAYFTVTPYPVGVESRVQEINSRLEEYAGDVCMVGIWGMGGIGKTTIAQALYYLIKCKFEGSCFLENIRTRSEQSGGLIGLQEQIISSAQVNSKKRVRDFYEGISVTRNIIQSKKFLLVLDDVMGLNELRKLVIDKDYFQPGSVIIITSRDARLLKVAGCDFIYESPSLDYNESFQLFSWHAFGKDHPNENYVELTNEVVYYANGIPLLLEVLGSTLFGKSTLEWKSATKELKESRLSFVEILMVSFHSLSDKQKALFLKIALFFVGMEKNYTSKILGDSDLSFESDLAVLGRRRLVAIDCLNRLTMHDLIIEMGKDINRRQSSEGAGEYSQLWFHEDRPSKGNGRHGWPNFQENLLETKFFEGEAAFEHNLYLSDPPTMAIVRQTEQLRSLEAERMLWEAERQILRLQLENERRAHLATCEDAARASWQLRVQNAALQNENIRLRMFLADARKFAPQLNTVLPCSELASESASSSLASNQPTIATTTPVASIRPDTLGLDHATFLDRLVIGIQSFGNPSESTPPIRGSDLSQ